MRFGLFPSWKIYFGLAALLTAVVGGSASAAAHRQVPVHPNLQADVAATATALSELMQAVNVTLTAEALQPTPLPPTATPIPGQADLAPFVVTLGQGINIRSGPGTTFAVIGGTVANQGFPVVGQANDCGWLQVVLEDGSTGWISGSPAYTRLNVACTAVPAAQAADSSATPTKTPGAPKVRPAFWPTLRPRGLATATAEPTATAIPPQHDSHLQRLPSLPPPRPRHKRMPPRQRFPHQQLRQRRQHKAG